MEILDQVQLYVHFINEALEVIIIIIFLWFVICKG